MPRPTDLEDLSAVALSVLIRIDGRAIFKLRNPSERCAVRNGKRLTPHSWGCPMVFMLPSRIGRQSMPGLRP
jgi:hypothetical protein